MTADASFLDVKDVRKQYGAIKAVDGVSFAVKPGEIVGVIGPNGSGKTTLFNAILGQIKPTSGAVEFCGEDITGMAPLELARRGVGRTFQTLQVFGKLSVRDNLIVAAQEFQGTLPGRLFAKPDLAEQLEHARLALVYGRREVVDGKRLRDRRADRHARIERCVRVLEDHLHLAAHRPQRALTQVRDVGTVEHDLAVARLVQP